MEWSKVKNIMILILITVNLFLLIQTAGQARQSRTYKEAARAGAIEVLWQRGYEVAPTALPEEGVLFPMTAERDRVGEEAFAAELLGTVVKTDDGVRVGYAGETGECWFRSDGSFAFSFPAGVYPAGGEVRTHAKRILSNAGYPCQFVSEHAEGNDTVVTVRQIWGTVPVFSCTAELTYRNGELVAVDGMRLIGPPIRDGGGEGAMDVPTALVRFMSGMREGGYVFTTVEALMPGYQATGSGRLLQLKPVWRIVTDAGVFFMDGVTGELTAQL